MTSKATEKISSLASRDPFYLGWYLARYSEMVAADTAAVAHELGCLPEVMSAMSLCRAPRAEPPHFREDIEAVANRFQVRADRLANIVRHVQVSSEQSTLLAARDRDPSDLLNSSFPRTREPKACPKG